MAEIVFYYYSDYAAAYEDGDLLFSGDDDTVKTNLLDHLGVKWQHSNAFMLGGNGVRVAMDLEELHKYENEQRERARKADELERQAKEMLARAEELRGK